MVRRSREPREPGPNAGPDADPESVARNILLKQLTMQARTKHELAEILRQKGVPGDAAEKVLHRFTEVGLIDDNQFAESWVSSRQQRRYLSKSVLRRELNKKGVEGEIIDEALEQVTPDDEYTAARALAEKKLRSMSALDYAVKRRRLAGALARKGFPGGLVSRVLSDVLSNDSADGVELPEWEDPTP